MKTEIHHEATSDETSRRRRRRDGAAGVVSGEFISRLPRRCRSRRLTSSPRALASPTRLAITSRPFYS